MPILMQGSILLRMRVGSRQLRRVEATPAVVARCLHPPCMRPLAIFTHLPLLCPATSTHLGLALHPVPGITSRSQTLPTGGS